MESQLPAVVAPLVAEQVPAGLTVCLALPAPSLWEQKRFCPVTQQLLVIVGDCYGRSLLHQCRSDFSALTQLRLNLPEQLLLTQIRHNQLTNCDCTYAIRFDSSSDVEGYDPDKYLAMYDDQPGNSDAKINSLRRRLYAENREEILAQKRSAYEKSKELESSAAEEADL